MTKNSPKPYVTTCNVFLTQNGLNKIFPDPTLSLKSSKQLFPVSDQVLDKSDVLIRKNVQKPEFLAKNDKIDHKKREFFQNPLGTFLA